MKRVLIAFGAHSSGALLYFESHLVFTFQQMRSKIEPLLSYPNLPMKRCNSKSEIWDSPL